ncbi:hypothetical protein EYF80_057331 [Liparis tanakae]|uniref:Uncharacterized protein n=1 Tax=Liparis tanakae TaxID=230148 RepID=A0A4Z2EUL7_9TELE|nr:hypothetical protein EYF80_057331 [Liparis tanakae]
MAWQEKKTESSRSAGFSCGGEMSKDKQYTLVMEKAPREAFSDSSCIERNEGVTLSVDNTSSVFSLGLVRMEYRGLRSGSMTVSPLSQRMMIGHSPLAVQFSSFR